MYSYIYIGIFPYIYIHMYLFKTQIIQIDFIYLPFTIVSTVSDYDNMQTVVPQSCCLRL